MIFLNGPDHSLPVSGGWGILVLDSSRHSSGILGYALQLTLISLNVVIKSNISIPNPFTTCHSK